MSAGPLHSRHGAAAFSLVELVVSLSLGTMLVFALITSYVFILRGDRALANYGEMNTQARRLLEILGRDLRAAVDVTNFDANTITISVPTSPAATASEDVTWEYDAANRRLIRRDRNGARVLATDVQTFAFHFANANNVTTTALAELKQVQLRLRMVRHVVFSTNSEYVTSAQFTLRAKATTI